MRKVVSLSKKILLTSIAVGGILAVVLLIASRYSIRQVVVGRAEEFFAETVSQIGMRIDMQLQNSNKNADIIARSQLLINYMQDLKDNRINYNIAKYSIMRNVIKLTDLEGIDGIYIFPTGKPVINCYYSEPQFNNSGEWFAGMEKQLIEEYPRGLWVVDPEKGRCMSQYRAILQGEELYGIVQIRYEERVFRSILDPAANHLEGIFYIADRHGTVLTASDEASVGGRMQADFPGDKLVLQHPLEGEPWMLTGAIDRGGITRQMQLAILFFVGIFLTLLGAICSYALLTFRYIRYPLKKIMHGFDSLGLGNLDIQLTNDVDTEFRFIIEGFNSMAGRIRNLVRQVYDQEISYRKAEISALQGKLNPHFLYNILDIVYWRVLMQDDEETAEILVSLSEILRYSISHGNEFVPLEEDVRHTESYLKIQQILFQHRLQYTIAIPEELLEYKIPKLIMQPVLENAIKHAFSDREGDLQLLITGTAEGEDILFHIGDNGAGMDPQAVAAVMRSANGEASGRSGLGLQIVQRRLQHTYGSGYGIRVDSQPGRGTTVILRLHHNTESSLRKNLKAAPQ